MMKNKKLFRRAIRFFVLLVVCFAFIQCGEDKMTYKTTVEIGIQNNTNDTLDIHFSYRYIYFSDFLRLDEKIIPPGEGSVIRPLYYVSDDPQQEFVNRLREVRYLFTQELHDKNLAAMTLSGKMVANWNDNSTIFTNDQYWTKIISNVVHVDDITECTYTLNITDEVLKVK